MSRKSRFFFAGFIIVAAVSAVGLLFFWSQKPDKVRELKDKYNGKYVGWSENEVVSDLGKPRRTLGYHFPFPERHPGQKTLVFGVEGGELYTSFEPRDEDWICFDCSYLPDGAVF